MKKLLLLVAICCNSVGMLAQDDMYFKPSSKAQKVKSHSFMGVTGTHSLGNDASSRTYTEDEIDQYNRQGYYINNDTLYLGDGQQSESYAQSGNEDQMSDYWDYSDDYYYSNRIARFYNPSVNFSIGWAWGVPYYWSGFDPYGDWFYDDIWYGRYYYPYYGWYRPLYRPWYDPWWGRGYHSYWRPRYYSYHGPTGTRNHSFDGRGWSPNSQNRPIRPNISYGRTGTIKPTNGTFGTRPQSSTTGRVFGTLQNRTNNSRTQQETKPSTQNIFGGSRAIPNTSNGAPSRVASPTMNRGGGSFGGNSGSFGGSRSTGGGHFGGRK